MPAFSISPAQGFARPDDEGFPNYIQFQANGANLGLPNADTLNFGSGLTATRGTGENANTVTVQATGGSSGGSTAFVGTFRKTGLAPVNTYFALWDEAETLVASPDCQWTTRIEAEDDEYYLLRFLRTGVYEITITGQIRAPSGQGAWFDGPSLYGSGFVGIQGIVQVPDDSVHSRYNPGNQGNPEYVQWSDNAIVTVLQDETLVNVVLWSEIFSEGVDIEMSGQISVVRRGDVPE